jgi:hypothetical protein
VAAWPQRRNLHRVTLLMIFLVGLLASRCLAQQNLQDLQTAPSQTGAQAPPPSSRQDAGQQINVNWLYGAYLPKEVPLESLNGHQRVKLWIRATFTTYGIYIKTALFSISDQARDSPPEWGGGWAGFGKRVASRQGQFVIQNSLGALGDGLLGYEPRYNRCQCNGFWSRTGHAVARNFITYDRTETKIRPRIPLYVAAFAAGVIADTWMPHHDWLAAGGHSALTQVGFGIAANFVGEFWPEVQRVLKRNKKSGN